MDQAGLIGELVKTPLNKLGYDLVRVSLTGGNDLRLQIMVERTDLTELSVSDCAYISRKLSILLDEEDPISDAYTLEISSPGIDRPLLQLADYERFLGYEAHLESRKSISGLKSMKGVIEGVDGGRILIRVGGKILTVSFEDIHLAKLVLTDTLISSQQKV